jgi:hypothetical protein
MIKVRVSLPDGTESSIDSERRNLIPHINEREDQQGAEIFPFNLVKLSRATRQERFYHRNDLPNKALSLNQRLRAICLMDHSVLRNRIRYGVGVYLLTLHTRRIVLMEEVRTTGLHVTDRLRKAWQYQIVSRD